MSSRTPGLDSYNYETAQKERAFKNAAAFADGRLTLEQLQEQGKPLFAMLDPGAVEEKKVNLEVGDSFTSIEEHDAAADRVFDDSPSEIFQEETQVSPELSLVNETPEPAPSIDPVPEPAVSVQQSAADMMSSSLVVATPAYEEPPGQADYSLPEAVQGLDDRLANEAPEADFALDIPDENRQLMEEAGVSLDEAEKLLGAGAPTASYPYDSSQRGFGRDLGFAGPAIEPEDMMTRTSEMASAGEAFASTTAEGHRRLTFAWRAAAEEIGFHNRVLSEAVT